MIVDSLHRIAPQWIRDLAPQTLVDILGTQTRFDAMPSYEFVQDLMQRYQTDNLVNTDPATFRKRIDEFLDLNDYEMEGYQNLKGQRDLSINFHWGHNHDFGDFKLKGQVGESHIALIMTFLDIFKVLPKSLEGLKILDIGCWTGGTSLLLAAMGAKVVAVEEVKKYIDCLEYLKHSFAIENLEPRNMSLYDCTTDEFQDSFDFVLFAGVLYHVTDPILALRITYNCLKDGGKCLMETAVHDSTEPLIAYHGPRVGILESKKNISQSGWNWFLPTPYTLSLMMQDVGFTDVQLGKTYRGRKGTGSGTASARVHAVGTRDKHVDILRAGLSVTDIR
ncbi:hypothetical protein MNBD_GAMMA05-1880 [hydrothermal vent metagenome]|uniref:Uncharacterized protein n=1 Tax=hydrothermal vent metagenome TaxID=652676 RepID=A0A3B0WQF4_9ZZZZ